MMGILFHNENNQKAMQFSEKIAAHHKLLLSLIKYVATGRLVYCDTTRLANRQHLHPVPTWKANTHDHTRNNEVSL